MFLRSNETGNEGRYITAANEKYILPECKPNPIFVKGMALSRTHNMWIVQTRKRFEVNFVQHDTSFQFEAGLSPVAVVIMVLKLK